MAEKTFTNVKRTRASKPKVRSGCVTCKIRRVKCDEAKPICRKCTSTGRKCDGYSSEPDRRQSANEVPTTAAPPDLQIRTLQVGIPGSSQEMRAFEHFRLRTAPALSAFHNSSFWSHVVLQTGLYEPAIMHAAAAVSLFHEQFEAVNMPLDFIEAKKCPQPEKGSLALQQYNKAINCLIHRASDDPDSHVFVLIACLLFVCMEFLRGNEATTITHIQNGLNILSKYQSPWQEEGPQTKKTPHFIGSNLVPIFSRLNLLAMLYGSKSSSYFLTGQPSNDHPDFVHGTFDSITTARNSMMNVLNISLNFIHTQIHRRYDLVVDHEALAEQARLKSQLSKWLKVFDTFESSFKFSFQKLEHREALQLRILHKTTLIWLATCTSPSECAFDSFTRDFRSIIALTSILEPLGGNLHSHEPELPKFSFEMGTITSLYFTAIKCRDPVVRREALSRLAHSRRREGLWDSHNVATVAARVIALEEEGIDETVSLYVSESARIHNSDICSPRRKDQAICVTFMTKPDGVCGELVWRREQLKPLGAYSDTAMAPAELIVRNAVPMSSPLIPKLGARCSVYKCAFD